MNYELDRLNKRYQKLQLEQNDILQAIKRIGQETTDKQAITQAFLEKHPNVVYKDDHGPRFTMDYDETIRISSSCFSDDDTATLKKLLNEFEQYMELLPYVRKNPNLEGNIAACLYNKTTRTDQYIVFGKHNTIIITTRCAHSVLDYAKIKDGVTITCNDRLPRPAYRPDDGWGLVDDQPRNLLCFDFELKESYDLPTNLEKLPQILDNLAERVASVRDEVLNPTLKTKENSKVK